MTQYINKFKINTLNSRDIKTKIMFSFSRDWLAVKTPRNKKRKCYV